MAFGALSPHFGRPCGGNSVDVLESVLGSESVLYDPVVTCVGVSVHMCVGM